MQREQAHARFPDPLSPILPLISGVRRRRAISSSKHRNAQRSRSRLIPRSRGSRRSSSSGSSGGGDQRRFRSVRLGTESDPFPCFADEFDFALDVEGPEGGRVRGQVGREGGDEVRRVASSCCGGRSRGKGWLTVDGSCSGGGGGSFGGGGTSSGGVGGTTGCRATKEGRVSHRGLMLVVIVVVHRSRVSHRRILPTSSSSCSILVRLSSILQPSLDFPLQSRVDRRRSEFQLFGCCCCSSGGRGGGGRGSVVLKRVVVGAEAMRGQGRGERWTRNGCRSVGRPKSALVLA